MPSTTGWCLHGAEASPAHQRSQPFVVRRSLSLPKSQSWPALSRHLPGEQKCSLHKGSPGRHRVQLPSRLQLSSLTTASFKATSALVKHDTSPATEKLQFIKPGIRRKRRRRMHGGEEQRRKSTLSQSHPNKKPRRTCAPANWQGTPGTEPISARAVRTQVLF